MKGPFTPALAYAALTPMYDLAAKALGFGQPFKSEVARLAAVGSGETVLDLGCGTGTLLQALAAGEPHARYTGIDPDPHVLAAARRRLTSSATPVTLVEGYAQQLPFPDNTFHLVISTLIFHHLPDPAKRSALTEVRRVLARPGRFLLVDFSQPQTAAARALLRIGSLFDGRENLRAHLTGELLDMLADAPFTVTELRRPYRGVRYLLARP